MENDFQKSVGALINEYFSTDSLWDGHFRGAFFSGFGSRRACCYATLHWKTTSPRKTRRTFEKTWRNFRKSDETACESRQRTHSSWWTEYAFAWTRKTRKLFSSLKQRYPFAENRYIGWVAPLICRCALKL